MAYKQLQKLMFGTNLIVIAQRNSVVNLNIMFYHSTSVSSHEEELPYEWYRKEFPKLEKLSSLLKNVDLIDGSLVNIKENSVIFDPAIEEKMNSFKSLARVFIGSPLVQKSLPKNVVAFSKPCEREPMVVNSLHKVANFLDVSSQKRKLVREIVCSRVTHHRIWTSTLEEILKEVKREIDIHNVSTKGPSNMAKQIISTCLKFLHEIEKSYCNDLESTSWMRLTPCKEVDYSASSKWEDVLEMFNDLIRCLKAEKMPLYHIAKLEGMKEGLSQIKGVMVDKEFGYKVSRHQESLVRKKLSKTLGHSSRCLFTLLVYYLYRHVRDIELDLCGGICNFGSEDRFILCMGRILTSDEDKMIGSGVKQLDRALQLFKFVWETAEMKGVLDLQGHLWCIGAEERSITYRGNTFFVHGINL